MASSPPVSLIAVSTSGDTRFPRKPQEGSISEQETTRPSLSQMNIVYPVVRATEDMTMRRSQLFSISSLDMAEAERTTSSALSDMLPRLSETIKCRPSHMKSAPRTMKLTSTTVAVTMKFLKYMLCITLQTCLFWFCFRRDVKFIPDAPDGLKRPLVRDPFQFFAEAFYVYVHRTRIPEIVEAPDLV